MTFHVQNVVVNSIGHIN